MSDKSCIITGASRGIGRAVADRFAQAGYKLLIAARGEAALAKAASELRDAGATCEFAAGDLAAPQFARELAEKARKRFGRIDVLVNNAGCAPLKPFPETTDEDLQSTFALNCAALFYTCQAVWQPMQAQGGGVIVNISSLASIDPFTGFSVYGASKAWVNTFTRALADEGKPHAIRVYAVAPGAVDTPLMRSAFPDFPAERALLPDDVAAVVESVCDGRMRAVTGETIFVRK